MLRRSMTTAALARVGRGRRVGGRRAASQGRPVRLGGRADGEQQPAADDRRFDEIGWAKDIHEAEKLAKDNGRLVFLFTHDGHIDVGRC